MRSIAIIIAWLVASLLPLTLTACKDAPGADGRYANRDHGNFRPP